MAMNKHFDIAYLRKYVNGELSSTEMYAIEKASHEDEQLMDIIMGLEAEKELQDPLEASELHAAIYERTHPTPVRSLRYYKTLSIAASLLLVLGIGTIWYLNSRPDPTETAVEAIAMDQQEAPTDTTLNTIQLDSSYLQPEENPIIAMASPEESAGDHQDRLSRSSRAAAKTSRGEHIDEIVSANQDIFLREIPKADSAGFQDSHDQLADASAGVAKQSQSSVIQIRGKRTKAAASAYAPMASSIEMSPSPDTKRFATGIVLDESSGRPLANVTVKDVKTNSIAITDSSGQYVMPLTSDNQTLELMTLGYEKQRLTASNNKITHMKPEFEYLQEVAVSRANRNAKIKSEPLIGWVAYKKYITDNTYQTLLGNGNVTLVFDISNFGRPIDIRIKKSSNPALNQRAQQIIQNGPDWRKGNDGKKIEVRMEFKQ